MKYDSITENFRKKILSEVLAIGDALIEDAETEAEGITWKTISIEGFSNVQLKWKNSFDMYKGVSGICVFLVELYRETNEEKYLKASLDGMRWVLKNSTQSPMQSYALLTGRMSIAHALLRCYDITNDKSFLKEALEIGYECEPFVNSPIYDLINGISGTVLGLLQLHSKSNDERILQIINVYVERILSGMRAGKKGVYWDRTNYNLHGICGFSHGASGLAYMFLELGAYFGNSIFFRIAGLAFDYENQYFDSSTKNWPDLRAKADIEVYAKKQEEAYHKGDLSSFVTPGEINAWCHGAAGIGLAKLRAFELDAGVGGIMDEINTCIKTTFKSDIESNYFSSHCLCHGGSGNGDLFIEAYNVFGDFKYLDMAQMAAYKIIAQKGVKGNYISGNPEGVEDNSLFMGNSGVGYFLLRLLNPRSVPSVLSYRVENRYSGELSKHCRSLALDSTSFFKGLIQTRFNRSMSFVQNYFPELLDEFLTRNKGDIMFKNAWMTFTTSMEISFDEKRILADITALEQLSSDLDESIESDNFLYFKSLKKRADIERLTSNEKKGELLLMTDSDLVISHTSWNWTSVNEKDWINNKHSAESENYVLLIPTYNGIVEKPISLLIKIILEAFESPCAVDDALTLIKSMFDEESSMDRIKELFYAQLTELINYGLLIDPMQHPINIRSRRLINGKSD